MNDCGSGHSMGTCEPSPGLSIASDSPTDALVSDYSSYDKWSTGQMARWLSPPVERKVGLGHIRAQAPRTRKLCGHESGGAIRAVPKEPSATHRSRLCGVYGYFTENGGNLFEFRGFIEKEICTSSQALLAVLGIRVVRANQNVQAGMVWTNRTQYVETRASRHLEVENHSIWLDLPDAANRFRCIACISFEHNALYVL